jgi:hypothetical protein
MLHATSIGVRERRVDLSLGAYLDGSLQAPASPPGALAVVATAAIRVRTTILTNVILRALSRDALIIGLVQ